MVSRLKMAGRYSLVAEYTEQRSALTRLAHLDKKKDRGALTSAHVEVPDTPNPKP